MDRAELNPLLDDQHWTTDAVDVSVQLLTDHRGQDDASVNLSQQPAHVDTFFSIYYSSARFTAETVLAMFSAVVNAAVLTTLMVGRKCSTQGHHSKTVYLCQGHQGQGHISLFEIIKVINHNSRLRSI